MLINRLMEKTINRSFQLFDINRGYRITPKIFGNEGPIEISKRIARMTQPAGSTESKTTIPVLYCNDLQLNPGHPLTKRN